MVQIRLDVDAGHIGLRDELESCSRNVDLVRSLDADNVIDYTKEDFAQSGQRYDLILGNAGNRSLSDRGRVLVP